MQGKLRLQQKKCKVYKLILVWDTTEQENKHGQLAEEQLMDSIVLICLSCLYKNDHELNIFVLDVCKSNDVF